MTTDRLHIGAFKTGTSFVQAAMDANREALRDAGVLWPGRTFGDQVAVAQHSGRAEPGFAATGPGWSRRSTRGTVR